jgi:propionyl-CoA synthetase
MADRGEPARVGTDADQAGSPSVPVPGYDVPILDEDGTEMGPGQEGAVCLKLPMPPGTLPTLWGADERVCRVLPDAVPWLLPHR